MTTTTGDTKTMKRTALAAAVAALAVLTGCGATEPTIVITPTPTPPPAPAPLLPPRSTFHTPATTFTDGTFEVLVDIKPGKYKTAGPVASPVPICYWARLKGTNGQLSDIITNGNPTGPTTVTISPSDAAFETQGCQPWTLTAAG